MCPYPHIPPGLTSRVQGPRAQPGSTLHPAKPSLELLGLLRSVKAALDSCSGRTRSPENQALAER